MRPGDSAAAIVMRLVVVVVMVVMIRRTTIGKTERTERNAAGRVDSRTALAARAERQTVGEARRQAGQTGTEDLLLHLVVAVLGDRRRRHDVIETEHLAAGMRMKMMMRERRMVMLKVSQIAALHPQARRRRHRLLLLLLGRRRFAATH